MLKKIFLTLCVIVILIGVFYFFKHKPQKLTVSPSQETASSTPPITYGLFNFNDYLKDEKSFSQPSSYTDPVTNDVVSFKGFTDAAHQFRNPSYQVYVNQKLVGEVGGLRVSLSTFSPDNRYFMFRSWSVLGCAGVCRDVYLYAVDLKNLNIIYIQTPVTAEGKKINTDYRYIDVAQFIDSYVWKNGGINITAFAIGLGKTATNYERITPKEVWNYNFTTGQYTLVQTLPE